MPQDVSPWTTFFVGVFGSGGLIGALSLWFNRSKTDAETEKLQAESAKISVDTSLAKAETTKIIEEAAGELIEDLRDHQKELLGKIESLEAQVRRIPELEEAIRELTEGVHLLSEQLLEAGINPIYTPSPKTPRF